MSNNMKILVIVVVFLFPVMPIFAQSGNETITITTYYPSPHGVYGVLTLYPRDTVPNNPRRGDMYFNSGNDTLLIYVNETVEWQPPVGGSVSSCQYQDGQVFYNKTDSKYYVYNSTGKTWVEAPAPGGVGGPGSGYVFTLSGNNPQCPSGSTAFLRNWSSQTFNTCRSAQGFMTLTVTPAGGWYESAPQYTYSCSIGTGICSMAGPFLASNVPCYSPNWGQCTCVLENWSMVMCYQN